MKISLIGEDLSTNALGRTYLLAEILSQDHEVEILGTKFGHGIWSPADTGRFVYRSVPGRKWPLYGRALSDLANMVSGDVIYASKPKASSFGAALLARYRYGIPVILDIDDDELAMKDVSLLRPPRELAWDILHPSGPATTRLVYGLISRADAVTVASYGLQKRHGGKWVPHAKDTERIRPHPEGNLAKERLGLAGHRVVMFAGTPRPWKGLSDVIQAVTRLQQPALLAIVGLEESHPAARAIGSRSKIRIYPKCPLDELPRFLHAADVLVVPQRDQPQGRVQLPSKLLDAMAVGKPVVGTTVSDIPFILGKDRGIVVPPEDPDALAAAIDQILADPEGAAAMGRRARRWVEKNASYSALRPHLSALVEQVGHCR